MLAGPFVNFVLSGVLWGLHDFGSKLPITDLSLEIVDFIGVFAKWNMYMGLLNLIPSLPLDGGRTLKAILTIRGHRNTMLVTGITGMVASILVLGVAAYMGDNFLVYFSLFTGFTSYQTYKAYKGASPSRREVKEKQIYADRQRKKSEEYLNEVRAKERERAERERLRKMFAESVEERD